MTNHKTGEHSNAKEPDASNVKLTADAFVGSGAADAANGNEQEQSPASAPAALEALSGKLGFTSSELSGLPEQQVPADPLRSVPPVEPHQDIPHAVVKNGHAVVKDRVDNDSLHPFAICLGVLFYMALAIGLASISARARHFMMERWLWLLLGAALIVAVAALAATKQWFKQTTAQRRIGIIIFAVIPLVTIAVGMVMWLPPLHRGAPLTIIFLLCTCLLPAVMYYLFIATKKYSILNEFIINLDRLGLLEAGTVPEGSSKAGAVETEAEARNRILTYLQKFEAVYGAFPTDLGGLLLQPTDLSKILYNRRLTKSDGSTFASIFTAETTVPVIIATVLIALGWLITLPPWRGGLLAGDENWLRIFTPEKTPEHFAFIGAYFFSLQLLFRRYVRRDLRPSAYVAVSLRIILAILSTWIAVAAMSAMLTQFSGTALSVRATNQLLVLGFVIGVFPRVLWQLIGGAVKSFGGTVLRVPSLQTELPISQLDGLTVWHESRLEEEDIENVPNMATADLVDMLLNTRFPPDRIIDWVDQAILYTHLGPSKGNGRNDPRREALRSQGIRTASALVEAYNRSYDRDDVEEFEQILKDPNSKRSPIRSLVDTMQTNPNLHLIQTWRGLQPNSACKPAKRDVSNQPAKDAARQ